jgi:hypothetical protein
MQFHKPVMKCPAKCPSSIFTVVPPATQRPSANCAATSRNNSGLGRESASTKINQSPVAAAAPVFRARAIWLMGSKTTWAPAANAISAVRSVELLLQTMISEDQSRSTNTEAAACTCLRVSPQSRSSLKAGIIIEIFKLLAASLKAGRAEVNRQNPSKTRTACLPHWLGFSC